MSALSLLFWVLKWAESHCSLCSFTVFENWHSKLEVLGASVKGLHHPWIKWIWERSSGGSWPFSLRKSMYRHTPVCAVRVHPLFLPSHLTLAPFLPFPNTCTSGFQDELLGPHLSLCRKGCYETREEMGKRRPRNLNVSFTNILNFSQDLLINLKMIMER